MAASGQRRFYTILMALELVEVHSNRFYTRSVCSVSTTEYCNCMCHWSAGPAVISFPVNPLGFHVLLIDS